MKQLGSCCGFQLPDQIIQIVVLGAQVSVYAVHVEWMQLWNLFVLNLEHMFINYYFLQSVTTIYINKAQSSSEMFSTGY